MVFSGVPFLFYFLPAFLVAYFLAPARAKNAILFLASLLFYSWGEGAYVVVLLAYLAFNYACGRLVGSLEGGRRKAALALGLAFNLSGLVWFKYAIFVLGAVPGSGGLLPGHLPAGISFYTFHSISYLVDVYRRSAAAERNVLSLAVYLSMFPQLIAGPIIRFKDICGEIRGRAHGWEQAYSGFRQMFAGLAQKVLIADNVGPLADAAFNADPGSLTAGLAWLGVVAYTFQIYFDFAGYSNMAIGMGRIMGLTYPRNFDLPYCSKSITEFWRRWHISLSTWFRDYLYIPLGGNRVSRSRTFLNLLAVFVLCGLWHGASFSFVVWGLWHGAFLVLERTPFGPALETRPAALRHAYALLVVMIGWVFFRSPTLPAAFGYLRAMACAGGACTASIPHEVLALRPWHLAWLAVAAALATPLRAAFGARLAAEGGSAFPAPPLARWRDIAGSTFLLLLSAMALAGGTYNAFLYFRF
ncbi:MAG TPA: MBOAT family O-acyltransferase [Burkholderiales bacterium]|nr:MBOAT family O-acyltransferase [Burkholderiales bacterium]